jgi:hypothetical protein
MTARIHVLQPPPHAVGWFVRLGHTGHRKLETLHAAGRLPIDRVVADAAHLDDQRDLFAVLQSSNVEVVLDTRRGAKAMLACDEGCCPRGVEDMLQSPKAHFLNQRARQVSELGRVPELRRADHFLRKQRAPTGSTARKAERLNLPDTALAEKLRERSRRLDEIHQVLEDLHETGQAASRSATLTHRAGSAPGMEARRR